MKKLFGVLALSITLCFVPIEAAKKKTTLEEKIETRSGKSKKAVKPSKSNKKTAKVEKKKVSTDKSKKTKASVARERKSVKLASLFKGKDQIAGRTAEGKPVFEGASKGHYYIDNKSNKVYVKDFVGAKIIGKTHDGRDIYEGPRGGHFYYTASGNKEYVKR